MHRFAEMLRRGGELDGRRILSPAMIELVTRNHTGDKPNALLDYAMQMRGWGAGSTAFWIDPVRDLTFSFLSTGLMEDSRHIERVSRLSDIALASLVE